jgi:DNA-binding Lrp family transcriptional regulator
MIDVVDELILSTLSKNSRQDTAEIWDYLRDHGYNLSEDEIDSRITKLEEERVISRYTISIDTKKVTRRIIRVALVRFKIS